MSWADPQGPQRCMRNLFSSVLIDASCSNGQNYTAARCCQTCARHHKRHETAADVYTLSCNWLVTKGVRSEVSHFSGSFLNSSLVFQADILTRCYTILFIIYIFGTNDEHTPQRKKADLKRGHCGLTNILYKQSFMTIHILQRRTSLRCSSWGWKDGWGWVLQTFLEC